MRYLCGRELFDAQPTSRDESLVGLEKMDANVGAVASRVPRTMQNTVIELV